MAKVTFITISVFDYADYKAYLRAVFSKDAKNRGLRGALAEHLRCQPSFISAVLNGAQQLSVEHSLNVSEFLGHTEEETEYFHLLLQLGRAGTRALEDFLRERVVKVQKARLEKRTKTRGAPTLSVGDASQFYSAWYFSATQMMTMLPAHSSAESIGQALGISDGLTREVIEFLLAKGLIVREKGRLKIGESRIHLPPDHPSARQHHANWRFRAVQSLDRRSKEDLHFTSVISLSESVRVQAEEVLQQALQKIEELIARCPDETLYALNLDWFRIPQTKAGQ